LNRKITYQFKKYFIYILLIGQLWSNVFHYANLYFNDPDDIIELTSTEKDSEKEMEDKIIASIFIISIYNTCNISLSNDFAHEEDLLPMNHLEINTPPPKKSIYI